VYEFSLIVTVKGDLSSISIVVDPAIFAPSKSKQANMFN
jgi:hypothetical protein